MVDCSHANSNKDPALQPLVMENVANQILEGNQSIIGLMVESHLNWGCQSIPEGPRPAAVRRVDHRCLHRLGRHRHYPAQYAHQAQGRAAETPRLNGMNENAGQCPAFFVCGI
jgi:3-deoxy-D-arabinoheptulosonate-7-phosphate synthase (EC 2.5.1.54)